MLPLWWCGVVWCGVGAPCGTCWVHPVGWVLGVAHNPHTTTLQANGSALEPLANVCEVYEYTALTPIGRGLPPLGSSCYAPERAHRFVHINHVSNLPFCTQYTGILDHLQEYESTDLEGQKHLEIGIVR